MSVLDRYVARNFVYSFAIALAVMVVMIISLDLMINLDEFTEDKAFTASQVLMNVWDYYSHQFFFYFSQLAGLMTLIAATVTVGRMVRSNELTALLSSGVPLQRVLAPVLACSAAIAGLWMVNTEFVIPNIADRLTRAHDDVSGKRTFEVVLFRESPPTVDQVGAEDRLFSAAAFYPHRDPAILTGLIVMCREQGRATWSILADRAWWDPDRRAWQLERGIKLTPPMATAATQPGEVSTADTSIRREEVPELRSSLSPTEINLRQSTQWIRFLSVSELNQMARRTDLSDLQKSELQRCRYGRMTEPLIGILTAGIGACFFLRKGPANLIVQTSKVLGVCTVIFALQFAVRSSPFADAALTSFLPLFMTAAAFGWVFGSIRS